MGKRFFVVMTLESFSTATSGETFTREGEWYFTVNGQRFPHKGEFYLGKNEPLDFGEFKPQLYTGMHEDGKEVKFTFKVKEKDVIRDDTFVNTSVRLTIREGTDIQDFLSRDKQVKLTVRIQMSEKPKW